MAGKVRYLLYREGRYFARLVIPRELRPFMDNKTELRTALGPDYRTALKKLPGEVALLQGKIALGEQRAAASGKVAITVGRYPLTPPQIAMRNYLDRLDQDEATRNSTPAWAAVSIDDGFVAQLRDGIAGRLSDDELADLAEHRIERFRKIGNTTAEKGTEDWRALARAICISEYEALARVVERDEGDFSGKPAHPMLIDVEPVAEPPLEPVSLPGLLRDYLKTRQIIGRGRGAEKRWTPVFANLVKFIGHDDARRLTKRDVMEWRDERLKTIAPSTVSKVDLAALRTVLKWAVDNDRLSENVAEKVRQEVPKEQRSREKGFTDAEALVILRAARDHVPAVTDNPATMEAPQTTAAKRWAPMMCAFSGARISEITQLRKEDFRREGDVHVMRLRPDAGTVKAGHYRDVPIHPQLVEMGLIAFVEAAPAGPLFFRNTPGRKSAAAAKNVSGRVSEWLQGLGVVPEGVAPSHGWRHRFKTVGLEEGISSRTLDAIQGHSAKTAGESYGDVTLKTRKAAIDKLPRYDL